MFYIQVYIIYIFIYLYKVYIVYIQVLCTQCLSKLHKQGSFSVCLIELYRSLCHSEDTFCQSLGVRAVVINIQRKEKFCTLFFLFSSGQQFLWISSQKEMDRQQVVGIPFLACCTRTLGKTMSQHTWLQLCERYRVSPYRPRATYIRMVCR